MCLSIYFFPAPFLPHASSPTLHDRHPSSFSIWNWFLIRVCSNTFAVRQTKWFMIWNRIIFSVHVLERAPSPKAKKELIMGWSTRITVNSVRLSDEWNNDMWRVSRCLIVVCHVIDADHIHYQIWLIGLRIDDRCNKQCVCVCMCAWVWEYRRHHIVCLRKSCTEMRPALGLGLCVFTLAAVRLTLRMQLA